MILEIGILCKGSDSVAGLIWAALWIIGILFFVFVNRLSQRKGSKTTPNKHNDNSNPISKSSSHPSTKPIKPTVSSNKNWSSSSPQAVTHSNSKTVSSSSIKKIQQFPELNKFGVSYLYHMTHIKNITSINRNGLLSHNEAHNKNLIKVDISNSGVQKRRNRVDTIYSKSLHAYVPLYFNPKNPMLYVRKEMHNDIAILCFDANSIFNLNKVIFTDGNAASAPTKFYSSVNNLHNLNWSCINSKSNWNSFVDGKRIRCAEVLVPDEIPFDMITKIICYNTNPLIKIINSIKPKKIRVEMDETIFF